MSENGSNGSIEEISSEEIENIGEMENVGGLENIGSGDTAEILIPEISESKEDTVKLEDPSVVSDDPPLDVLQPQPPAAAAVQDVDAAGAPSAAQVPEAVAAAEVPAAAATVPDVVAAAVVAAPEPEPVGVVEEIPRAPHPDPPAHNRQVGLIVEAEEDDEEDDDDIDETLTERLIGLTEMFPDGLRTGSVSLVKGSWSLTKSAYGMGRSAAWIVFSTAAILFMPVMIETERLSIMDQQKQQKTQMLLGPGVASSGPPSLGPPPI